MNSIPAQADCQRIPMELLTPCPVQLRPVRRQSLEYLQLKESIRKFGVLQSLLVRPKEGKFQVVCGNNRYCVGKDLHLPDMPCIIRELSDSEVDRMQLVENELRNGNNPVENARRLWKIIRVEQALTLPELAHSLSLNVGQVNRMLSLVNLCTEVEDRLAENQLPIRLAVELAKLPHDEQRRLLPVTGGVPNGEALELIRQAARHFRQGEKSARVARKLQDTAELQPIFRKRQELLDELATPTMMASVFEACDARTDGEKWKAVLRFVFQIDPASIERRRKQSQTGEHL